jgi:hypothetical protein
MLLPFNILVCAFRPPDIMERSAPYPSLHPASPVRGADSGLSLAPGSKGEEWGLIRIHIQGNMGRTKSKVKTLKREDKFISKGLRYGSLCDSKFIPPPPTCP